MKRHSHGRILIAEDDNAFAAQLASVLEGEGFATMVARDGNEAVKMLSQGDLEIALVDLAMPCWTACRFSSGRPYWRRACRWW